MSITALPEAPSRATPATFSALADAFLAALATFVTEANALETNVNAKEVLAVAAAATAEASEAVALAAANYVGPWADQVGAAAVPYAVSHLDQYWQLVSDLADVTAKTPGTDSEWIQIGWTVQTMQEATYAADAEESDTYVITLSPVPGALFDGMIVSFKANTANTGTATLNVNELGAKTIKKNHDQDLATGDIESGQKVLVQYDGTNFQMLSQTAAGIATDTIWTEANSFVIGTGVGTAEEKTLSETRDILGMDVIEINILLNAFRIAINGGLVKFNMVDGIMDEFEDESGVDTGTSTGESYDSGNDLYSVTAGAVVKEAITNHSARGFYGGSGTREKVAQSFQVSSGAITCAKVALYLSKTGLPTDNITCTIETDDAGKPSGTLVDVNATKLLAASTIAVGPDWVEFAFAGTFSLSQSTTYWIVLARSGARDESKYVGWRFVHGTGDTYADGNFEEQNSGTWENVVDTEADADFKVYSASVMSLQSELTEAEANPDTVRIVLMEEDVDAVTENTDLKAYASRDDGANWVQATLVDEGNYGSGKRILEGEADVSGQAADKTVKWKVTTHNSKDLKLHGIGLLWK